MNARRILGDELFNECQNEIWDTLDHGGSYDEIEEILMNYGLEMDYLLEFIG